MTPLLCSLALATTPPPVDLAAAEPLETLDKKELKVFAPRHWKLPANARGQTDYTAYTLEWGEFRFGLAGVSMGVLPRTQLGTVPVLDALGVPNLQAKVNPLRVGPLDVSANVRGYVFKGETLGAAYVTAGGTASLMVVPAWSVHAGAEWSSFAADGYPNLDPVLPYVEGLIGWAPPEELLTAAEEELSFSGEAQFVSTHIATDVRFNRRDSLILQGSAVIWGRTDLPFEVPATMTGGAPIAQNAEGAVPITDAYTATLAYQLAMKHLELRVGVGVSSVPGAWLLQSTELAWRWGGKTRSTERRMVKGWRRNKRDPDADAATSTSSVPAPVATESPTMR